MIATRLAPSPTGKVHIGTLRTLYHNWLAARALGGKFIFRIDDTDLERSRKELIDPLFKAIDWLGLDYDETFKQSDRFDMYRSIAEGLVKNQLAIEDNGCIRLNKKYASQFSANWRDSLTGFKQSNENIMDFASTQVIIKSDGSPTYNFATVIDDAQTGITHLIRGVDHISNTYKQVLLYNILGRVIPKFYHVGLVCHKSGKKLSKRDSDALNLENYHPDAVLNYILRLGWSPKEDNKQNNIIKKDRAIKMFFNEGKMKAANAKIDLNKLQWYDKKYRNFK